ncbi:putative assimilatory sulfite reductase (ferredoxin) [Helianthus debilis subsp. tardiflorus]
MAELGLVGDGPNSYQIWLVGTPAQTSLARTFMNKVNIQDLEKVFKPLFYNWRLKRKSKESFGDFTNRVGFEKLEEIVVKWEGVSKTSLRYYLKLFTDKETYEAIDALARVENKNAHQLAIEVILNYAASQQNVKHR